MRRLARQLEVVPGALYWHVPNKQSLLEAIAESILEPVFTAPTALIDDWQAQTSKLAATLRRAMIAHRDGADVVLAALPVGDLRTRLADALKAAIAPSGLPAPEVDIAAHSVLDFVMGNTLAAQSAVQLAEATGSDAPGVASQSERFSERFDAGLRIVLAGISATQPLK